MWDGERRVGVFFDCPGPCCAGKRSPRDTFDVWPWVKLQAACPFTVALDGTPYRPEGWERTGDTFESLTLSPSVWIGPPGHWHGQIIRGEATNA
jgi:hypothetical protein